jgi:hypothetical protein
MSLLEFLDNFRLRWNWTIEPWVRDDLINGRSVNWIDLKHTVQEVNEVRTEIVATISLLHGFPEDIRSVLKEALIKSFVLRSF